MEPKFQTSFIPKESGVPGGALSARAGINLFLLLGLVLFFAVALVSVGTVFYGKSLRADLVTKEGQLKNAREAFGPALIQELKRLSERIENAKGLLSSHLSFGEFFNLLESATLKTVSFTDFTLAIGDKGAIQVSMKGLANGFNSVALQSDAFGKQKFIKNPIFSDFTLDKSGRVTFAVVADVEPSILVYKDLIEKASDNSGGAGASADDNQMEEGETSLPDASFEELDDFNF